MNTCGTCKFFGQPVEPDEHYVPTGFHICRLVEQLDRFGTINDLSKGSVAGVVDASGFFAALCIKEEFGCNQWAAKASGQETGG